MFVSNHEKFSQKRSFNRRTLKVKATYLCCLQKRCTAAINKWPAPRLGFLRPFPFAFALWTLVFYWYLCHENCTILLCEYSSHQCLTATLARPKVGSVNSLCQKSHYQRQYKCDTEYLGLNEVVWVFPSVFGCKIEVVPYCLCFQPDFHTVQLDLLPIHCLSFLQKKLLANFQLNSSNRGENEFLQVLCKLVT